MNQGAKLFEKINKYDKLLASFIKKRERIQIKEIANE